MGIQTALVKAFNETHQVKIINFSCLTDLNYILFNATVSNLVLLSTNTPKPYAGF